MKEGHLAVSGAFPSHTREKAPKAAKRRLIAATASLIALLSAGCGGSNGGSATTTEARVPGGADPADVQVIEGWVDALRRGDIDAAAGYFAIPSVAENGAIIRIHSVDQAKLFNAALPCGATLIRAVSAGKFTTGTFKLSERRGPGAGCGLGVGGTAQTSFVIRDGKIAQWRRVGAGGGGGRPPSTSA
jgi:hypothetical protein